MEPCEHEARSPSDDEFIRACDEAVHRYEVEKRARETTVEDEDIFVDDDSGADNIQRQFKRLCKNHKDEVKNEEEEGSRLEDNGDLGEDDEED